MEIPKHIRTLEKTGFTRDQAETHVRVTTELTGRHMDKFATKEDFKELALDVVFIKKQMNLKFEDIDKRFVNIDRNFDTIHNRFTVLENQIRNLEPNIEHKIVSKLTHSMRNMFILASTFITTALGLLNYFLN